MKWTIIIDIIVLAYLEERIDLRLTSKNKLNGTRIY